MPSPAPPSPPPCATWAYGRARPSSPTPPSAPSAGPAAAPSPPSRPCSTPSARTAPWPSHAFRRQLRPVGPGQPARPPVLVARDPRDHAAVRPRTTPSHGVGVAPETVRTWPGALRSTHPQTSFAARTSSGPVWTTVTDTSVSDEGFAELGAGFERTTRWCAAPRAGPRHGSSRWPPPSPTPNGGCPCTGPAPHESRIPNTPLRISDTPLRRPANLYPPLSTRLPLFSGGGKAPPTPHRCA